MAKVQEEVSLVRRADLRPLVLVLLLDLLEEKKKNNLFYFFSKKKTKRKKKKPPQNLKKRGGGSIESIHGVEFNFEPNKFFVGQHLDLRFGPNYLATKHKKMVPNSWLKLCGFPNDEVCFFRRRKKIIATSQFPENTENSETSVIL